MTMENWLNKTLLPNDVVKNKWDITDREELEKVEKKIFCIKTQDILEQQLSIGSIEEPKLKSDWISYRLSLKMPDIILKSMNHSL